LEVIAGTTDSTAAVIAAGARQIGEAVTSLGSTLVVKILASAAINVPEYGVYSHRYGDSWLVGGASNSGGAVLRTLFSDERIRQLTTSLRPDRPTGLDYYPLPGPGERFPVNDPDLAPRLEPRPASDGLFFQGVLEGIARIEAAAYERLASLGAPAPSSVLTLGGGADNPGWTRIRERTLDLPVRAARVTQAAFGAALLALDRGVPS
jgi:sugar (pentulose or hexulose) kinase